MPASDEDRTTTTATDTSPGTTTYERAVGLVSVLLWVLAVYFGGTSLAVDNDALSPAAEALGTGLRIVAGACALVALVTTVHVLGARDQRVLRDQQRADQ